MNILGINGLSRWGFHDPSACLISEGRLVHFVEEERLIRLKHAPGIAPRNAALSCLQAAQLSWYDLDKIAVGWDLPTFAKRADPALEFQDVCRLLLRDIGAPNNFPVGDIEFVAHHEAHAWSGLVMGHYDPALLIVIDGQGEDASTSIFRFSKGELELLVSYDASFSLGYFYEAVAWYVGLGLDGTGKLMGLADYWEGPTESVFVQTIASGQSILSPVSRDLIRSISGSVDDAKAIVEGHWISSLQDRFPDINFDPRKPRVAFEERQKLVENLDATHAAAFAQKNVEEYVCTLISEYIEDTDTAIILSGGVALNCKMNGLISRHYSPRPVIVPPVPHDAGTALGAAAKAYDKFDAGRLSLCNFPYTGAEFSDHEIERICSQNGVIARALDSPALEASARISDGQTIGWFQGPAEVGPRALGGRSILAQTSPRSVREHINSNIKMRENWRPFGLMVLEGYESELFFECDDARYMIKSFPVIDERQNMVRAALHVDGSTRPQIVAHELGSTSSAELLACMKRSGEKPWMLNTSFNCRGEPMVYSPKDAIETFKKIPLDALIIGQFIIE